MVASSADWISPGRSDGFAEDPPAWNAEKVSLLDTDHIWGVGGNPAWVWKSLLRGHNPLFMDPYDGSVLGTPSDKRWEPIRATLGYARDLAERVHLALMQPLDDLASTKYCLANPGGEYLIYQPNGGETFSVELKPGVYRYEWIDAGKGSVGASGRVESPGGSRSFKAPFEGQAVLYLKAQ